jgi:predicted dehydrogenase
VTTPVGVGIVGTGLSATQHLTALKDVDNGRVVAVAGTSLEKARAFADKWGIERAYGSHEELVRDPGVEAVHVCTPPFQRAPVALAAAAAGKHMLVEKPIARTGAEADEIIRACDEAGLVLAAMFQNRFTPLARTLKRAVDEGRLGKLLLATLSSKWFRTAEYYASGSGWRGTLAGEGGAALISQAIHSIDLLLWICGDPVEVRAMTATTLQPIEAEDVGMAMLRFPSGAVGSIVGTTVAYPGFSERLELHGTLGSVALVQGEGRLEWFMKGQDPRVETAGEQVSRGSADPAAISYFGHSAEFRDFYAAIREGRQVEIPGREGRRAVALIEAIYRSSREMKPVAP